jgi:hypothetical protein
MRPDIYIDVDETLVWTARVSYHPELVKLPEHKIIKSHIADYISFLRPGAKELINECQKLGNTAILTSGDGPFQTEVLAAHGITGVKVYGRGTQTLPAAPTKVLIEDLDICTMGAQDKLHLLLRDADIDHWGRIEEPLPDEVKYIKVKPWYAPNLADTELQKATAQLQKIIIELQKPAIPEIS